MIKEICDICESDDFGYCGLRNREKEVEVENDSNGNVVKCSEFSPDGNKLKRMFLIKDKG